MMYRERPHKPGEIYIPSKLEFIRLCAEIVHGPGIGINSSEFHHNDFVIVNGYTLGLWFFISENVYSDANFVGEPGSLDNYLIFTPNLLTLWIAYLHKNKKEFTIRGTI